MDDPAYSLWLYLSADLRRFHATMHSGTPAGRLRLALYLLSPRFAPMLLCRLAFHLHKWRLSPLAKLVSLLNFVMFGIEIAVRCPIGPGLFFPHTQGTVVGASRIGANATIYQGVTIGAKELDGGYNDDRRPAIGDDVLIGSGAKVLGPIEIGNGVRIGANAVVVDTLPPGVLAVGAVARIIERNPS